MGLCCLHKSFTVKPLICSLTRHATELNIRRCPDEPQYIKPNAFAKKRVVMTALFEACIDMPVLSKTLLAFQASKSFCHTISVLLSLQQIFLIGYCPISMAPGRPQWCHNTLFMYHK